METLHVRVYDVLVVVFFNHFPERGWKPPKLMENVVSTTFSIISPKGDGNKRILLRGRRNDAAFSIISPKGDGNASTATILPIFIVFFFNHFPERGWKQPYTSVNRDSNTYNFFNHFPERGWKLVQQTSTEVVPWATFSIISPKGDGNS